MKLLFISLFLIFASILTGCENRNTNDQISEEKAKEIAIIAAYGSNQSSLGVGRTLNVVLDTKKERNGDFLIHLCDLNVECPCIKDQGYWVNVKYDGSESKIVKTNFCPFG